MSAVSVKKVLISRKENARKVMEISCVQDESKDDITRFNITISSK